MGGGEQDGRGKITGVILTPAKAGGRISFCRTIRITTEITEDTEK